MFVHTVLLLYVRIWKFLEHPLPTGAAVPECSRHWRGRTTVHAQDNQT
jgi:hypothetical protein